VATTVIDSQLRVVGQSVPRLDAVAKATGRAAYVDDLQLPGMLYARTLRSPVPHARILSIDTAAARRFPGVKAVLTAADIPGEHCVGPVIKDQPVLAEDVVRYVGEPVAIVAAETRESAAEALSLITVHYDPLPPVLTPGSALAEGAPTLHAGGNIAARTTLRHGDAAHGLTASAVVVEGTFETQMVEHAYIEPEAAVASVEPDGTVVVRTATQYIHYDRDEIARVLGLPASRVRVLQMTVGGGFGGKGGFSLPQCHVALLAVKTGRPAKIVYTRAESIGTTVKRHPYTIHLHVGASAEGRLLAIEATLTSDTGAYLLTGKPVLTRSTTHASGPYAVPNVHIDGCAVYTNNPSCGAMRGYGVPQVAVALETLLDELASWLKIDPIELRLKNALDVGLATATGQVLTQSVGIREVLRQAQGAAADFRAEAVSRTPGKRRGVGVAASWHGVGAARAPSEAVAIVQVARDGSVTVLCGVAEIGQGAHTAMAQIAAQELQVPVERVQVVASDSAVSPDCEATTASRVTYISGNAVRRAAGEARERIIEMAAEALHVVPAAVAVRNGVAFLQNDPSRRVSLADLLHARSLQGITVVGRFAPDTVPLDQNMQGVPHAAWGFGAHVVLVEVDEETGKVDVVKLAAFNDVGHAINPLMVEGQAAGGASMGIGYALFEEIRLEGGRVVNPWFSTYTLGTALDAPEYRIGIIEEAESTGPYGAKGIGELVVNPAAPAILNAIRDATGVRLTRLPATPERVLAALQDR